MGLTIATRVALYGVSSSALLVLNKIAITAVPNASLLLLIQILSTVTLILVPALAGYVNVRMHPERSIIKAYFSVAVIFLATIYSNFQVVHSIGVNSFIVLRCGTPLLICFLDWLFLNRALPRGKSIFSLLGVFLSGTSYAYLKYQEAGTGSAIEGQAFGFRGLVWSLIWLSCFVMDMIYIKHITHVYTCTSMERTLYQNFLSIPVLLILLFSPLESSSSLFANIDPDAAVVISLSCIAGAVLSYTGMSLRTDLSATAFTMLGILCKMASALLNEIFVAREPNRWSLLCISMVIVSSSFYEQAPIRDPKDLPMHTGSRRRRLSGFVATFGSGGLFLGILSLLKSPSSSPFLAPVLGVPKPGSIGIAAGLNPGNPGMVAEGFDATVTGPAGALSYVEQKSLKTLQQKQLWGVTTTILEVNPAVEHFVTTFDANLVVVGDKKTNHTEWTEFEAAHENVMYLPPMQQDALGFEVMRHIPWNHFGRKSVGFLVAIKNGADIIYDFDDDNHLTISSLEEVNRLKVVGLTTDHHVFNPYPYFKAQHEKEEAFAWPRGFPLGFINDEETYVANGKTTARDDIKGERLAVIQSLADHDPDVDAIYRLTRRLPLHFQKKKELIVPPRGAFTPWNAQAVLLRKPSFFGLLLPITVTGRVSDIWRSYLTSRLLWETDYLVGFSSPFVTQFRNPHSYMKDLEDEKDLYFNVDQLLSTLLEWNSANFPSLEEAYLNLVSKVVSLGLLGDDDLALARAWCNDLRSAGYHWPRISSRLQPRSPKQKPVIDERNLGELKASPQRNAVCLIGKPHDDVEKALREHVLSHLDADLFAVLPTHRNSSFQSEAVVTWLDSRSLDVQTFFDSVAPAWRNSAPGNHLGGLPGHDVGHGAFQLKDRWDCENIIAAHESIHGHKYAYVGIGRADLLWLLPHPSSEPEGCWIPCQTNDYGGLCDHWAWCERSSARIYMTAPILDIPTKASSNKPMNTELHLKTSLKKHKVQVERGRAAFVRLCATDLENCASLPQLKSENDSRQDLFAKSSGGQIEEAKNELLRFALDSK